MADDKSNIGKQDRDRVSASDHYEIGDFADKFNLSAATVHELIKHHANDRDTLEREARKVNK